MQGENYYLEIKTVPIIPPLPTAKGNCHFSANAEIFVKGKDSIVLPETCGRDEEEARRLAEEKAKKKINELGLV